MIGSVEQGDMMDGVEVGEGGSDHYVSMDDVEDLNTQDPRMESSGDGGPPPKLERVPAR